MADKKMPISLFVAELEAALNRKDGYIMGAKGQDPKRLNDWFFEQYADRDEYTEKQEAKALYWKEHAQRVWDCNGLPEGIYQDYTGVNINTKARYNYAQWCEPKGTGIIPPEYRVPGAAVFTGSKASSIPHVMFLYKPVEADKPEGDWHLIEARGVLYGVVKTRLLSRKPTFWGLMTKYFDYSEPAQARKVRIEDGDCWVRTQPNLDGDRLGVVREGTELPYAGETAEDIRGVEWHLVEYAGTTGWVSSKYGKLI